MVVQPLGSRVLFSFPSPCCGAKALTSFGAHPWMELVRFYCPFCRVSRTGRPSWNGKDIVFEDPVRIDWDKPA